MKISLAGRFLAICALASSAGTLTYAEVVEPDQPEASAYDEIPEVAATARLMAMRTVAITQGKRMLVIFGANWCHDSRALAGTLQTPRFRELVDRNFAVLFIDAGKPQEGEGRNMELAARLRVPDIEGTPNLLVIEPVSGALLNSPDSARSWRDAASRSADAIYDELASYAQRPE